MTRNRPLRLLLAALAATGALALAACDMPEDGALDDPIDGTDPGMGDGTVDGGIDDGTLDDGAVDG